MKLGEHYIIDLYDCDYAQLNSISTLKKIFLELVDYLNVTYINDFFHKFSPYGVSGVVVIAESHFTIHTYPEYGYCAIDIFTCGEKPIEKSLQFLQEKFNTTNSIVYIINRGEFAKQQITHLL